MKHLSLILCLVLLATAAQAQHFESEDARLTVTPTSVTYELPGVSVTGPTTISRDLMAALPRGYPSYQWYASDVALAELLTGASPDDYVPMQDGELAATLDSLSAAVDGLLTEREALISQLADANAEIAALEALLEDVPDAAYVAELEAQVMALEASEAEAILIARDILMRLLPQ